MRRAVNKLGASEVTVQAVGTRRMQVAEEEYSVDIQKESVTRLLFVGDELQGGRGGEFGK